MVSPDEIRRLKGQRAALQLAPDVPGGPTVTGRIVGTIEAADGLVLTVEPDGSPGKRLTIHYHHVLKASPV